MELKDIDTSKFLYDPKKKESYQKLYRFSEFFGAKEKVIQYVILMYDMANEEIVNEYPFYPNRKREICRMIGLKITKSIEEMLIGKDLQLNAMIVKYITLFNNPDLLNLASFYEIFIFLNQKAFSGDVNTANIKDIEKVNASIKRLEESIFRGKDETELRKELYKTVREQALGIRPEEIAEKLARGEDPLEFNPYKDYEPEKMNFIGDK